MRNDISGCKAIVSLTPLPIQSDSRTFKQAASVARLGYRSIVLEGPSSGLDRQNLPFELIATFKAVSTASEVADVPTPSGVRTRGGAGGSDDGAQPAAQPVRSPRRLGLWDRLRKVVRARIERMPGGIRFVSLLWLIELRASVILHMLRNPAYAFNILKFSPKNFIYQSGRLILNILIKRVVGNKNYAFIKYFFGFIYKYGIINFNKIPSGQLYYLHAFYQFPGVYLRCKLSKSAYIYDAHDFYSEMDDPVSISDYWRRWVMPFHLIVERACVRNAAAVVTVNEGIADLMREKFGREVVVLRNSHDPRLDATVHNSIRDVLSLSSDIKLAVSLGQWKPDKAISQAIAAFAELPERFHLAFVGAGFPSYAAEVAARGVEGRIHFLPPVKPTEVVPFIRSADIGLMLLYNPASPNIRYCLPNGFFQSTAAGLPILYPRLPEIMRIAERHDLGLLIDPLDPTSIAAGAAALCDDDELFRAKKASVLAARDALSWEQDEERLKSLFEGLIGLPNRAR